jgi:nucleoside-diphosphate-sugar epimerase
MTVGDLDPGNTTGRLVIETANRTIAGYVNGKRNVMYAGDAGRGLVLACEKGVPGERYLLTGENLTMSDLMGRIASLADTRSPPPIPLGLARAMAWWQELRFRLLAGPIPRVSATAIAIMSQGQYLSGTKAKRELGFESRVSVDEAIERALRWFRLQRAIR